MSPDPDSVIVVGAGLAGLLTALQLAPRPVTLLAAGAAASAWAQGGIAAAVGTDDSPALHLDDTLAAGAGLCDRAAAERIIAAGPEVITTLAQHGVRFDRDGAGRLQLGLEAAHGRRRIVHAAGDGTGREIMRALIVAVAQMPSVYLLKEFVARRVLVADGRVCGILAQREGELVSLQSSRVVLATGGIGGLFQHTTNPVSSWGAGLAMAARAGAALRDLEFVQFHPTALDIGRDPMPLVSEAVRGEGATLVDGSGVRIMAGFACGDLEPRDVVSRAVWRVSAAGGSVRLDARSVAGFGVRFPGIEAMCRVAGIDPATQPIPVRPAAHYHMGGIAVDAHGRSTLPGLWAVGEVACTGVHGANRLASNSLLEAAVSARFVAEDVAQSDARRPSLAAPPTPPTPPTPTDMMQVRPTVSRALGVLRDGAGLIEAMETLLPMESRSDPALVGLMIAVAAHRRPGRIGSHWRSDGGEANPVCLPPMTMADALADAMALTTRLGVQCRGMVTH